MKKDDKGKWHLFEVKSSTKIKNEHLADICFQLHAFSEAGIEFETINIILVNNEYVYREAKGLEVDDFLNIEDITIDVHEKLEEYRLQIEEAYKILTADNEPKVPALKKSFSYPLPEKFSEYYWKGIPDYSIYDINNIRKKNLIKLNKLGAKLITDIPDNFFDSDNYNRQVELTKQKTALVDKEGIKAELEKLEYPLYFLDYETINPAIPLFDKVKPHQKIPFQYSLHVLDTPDSKIRHMDFLHTDKTNPIPFLLKALRGHMGDSGAVLVWNDTFELGCNRAMAKTCPEHEEFMNSVNSRIADLLKIVKANYQDYRFKGSYSIKNVLPVLAPELNYKELEVQHGGMAMDGILDLIDDKTDDKEKLIKALKEYCKLDTWAMVRIFQVLQDVV